MFENMSFPRRFVFVKYVGECQNDKEMKHLVPILGTYLTIISLQLGLSILGFLVNTVSTVVFCLSEVKRRRRKQLSNNSVNISLLMLSFMDASLSLWFFCSKLFYVMMPHFQKNHLETDRRPPDAAAFAIPVLFNMIDFWQDWSVVARNWIICLISLARAEVIMWPLGRRPRQRFLRNYKTFLTTALCILALCLLVTLLKKLDYMGILCFSAKLQHYHLTPSLLYKNERLNGIYDAYIFFSLQACIPWIIVSAASCLMIVRLNNCCGVKKAARFNANSSADNVSRSDAIRKRNQQKATRTILALAVTFTMLEFPSIVAAILIMNYAGMPPITVLLVNFLGQIDTIVHFFIFQSTLPGFRRYMQLRYLKAALIERDGQMDEWAREGDCKNRKISTFSMDRISLAHS